MNPSFYVLSSGEESTDGNTPNSSLSGSTHHTTGAKYHIKDVETFALDLNDAAKSAFPNRGRLRYETVNTCLIRWEEDTLLVEPELNRLSNVFQDYGFTTDKWLIPTKNPHLALMMKTGKFIQDVDSEKNLFIVYYGGHGKINSERQAEWLCTRDVSSPRVHWSAIQTLFAEAQSDVLILLDACAAASATTKSLQGSMEAIMACGFESKAPPPGEHSFTNTLINVLDEWIDRRSFSASCLHTEILSQLKLKENKRGREGKRLEWCVTPIHINCTQDPKAPSIELCRRNILPPQAPVSSTPESEGTKSADAMDLDFDDPLSSPASSLSSVASSGEYRIPHVIISVALEENQPELDAKETARWLASIPFLAKWAKVEAVFKSYSTLLLLSIPVPVWNMLPDHPACSFVGYATSPNLVANLRPQVDFGVESLSGNVSGQSTKPSLPTVLTADLNFGKMKVNNDTQCTLSTHDLETNSSQSSVGSYVNDKPILLAEMISSQHKTNQSHPSPPTHNNTEAHISHLIAQTQPQALTRTPRTKPQLPAGRREILKAVHASIDDPTCTYLLPTLKNYTIGTPWDQYIIFLEEFTKLLVQDLPGGEIKAIAGILTALGDEKAKDQRNTEKGRKMSQAPIQRSKVAIPGGRNATAVLNPRIFDAEFMDDDFK